VASKGQVSELHLRVPADVALEFVFSLLMLGGNLLFERHFPVNEPRSSQVESLGREVEAVDLLKRIVRDPGLSERLFEGLKKQIT
jgi:hypothetical protein